MSDLVWREQQVEAAHLPIQLQLKDTERQVAVITVTEQKDKNQTEVLKNLSEHRKELNKSTETHTHLRSRQHVVLFDLDRGLHEARAAADEEGPLGGQREGGGWRVIVLPLNFLFAG